ncbi:MAG: nickel-dependent lactate racemase, partial [Kiritimatiellaceae bacterium]|nr:nickel-dependent lactate racemase [Kiritimatiellaceae bacterium]
MISKFGENVSISEAELRELVFQCLEKVGELTKVLLLPPDHTRLNSMAGPITAMVYEKLVGEGVHVDILPTLGTHNPMTEAQLRMMFGDSIPLDAFRVHDWRNEVVRKGLISGEMLSELSDGKVDYTVGVEVNKMLFDGYDLILSV